MNCFIGHTFGNQKNRLDTADENPLRSTSLALEILESAHFFFQHKGFEKTAIEDICNRLNINSAQFYNHFESLDEVLEIVWAR